VSRNATTHCQYTDRCRALVPLDETVKHFTRKMSKSHSKFSIKATNCYGKFLQPNRKPYHPPHVQLCPAATKSYRQLHLGRFSTTRDNTEHMYTQHLQAHACTTLAGTCIRNTCRHSHTQLTQGGRQQATVTTPDGKCFSEQIHDKYFSGQRQVTATIYTLYNFTLAVIIYIDVIYQRAAIE
jgi:hypothetical protein